MFLLVFAVVIVKAQPATPPVPTVSTNLCGDKILTRGAPPTNVTYYWQGTSCGTLTTNSALTYNVTASGTYYLRAMNTSSQWSTSCASVSVTVNPVPTAPAVPTVSTNLCGDKTITRVAPPAGITYYWQGTSCGSSTTNSDLTYTATASGTYYINAYSSAGCWSSCSSNIVTVNPFPTAAITGLADTVIINDPPITLTGTPTGGVFSGDGVASGIFTPADAGLGNHTITYTYTSTEGCADADTKVVYVKNSVGIENVDYENYISIYPTPSKGMLNVKISAFSDQIFNYSVINAVGKIEKEGRFINKNSQVLDFGNLSNGIYFLKLQNENVIYTKKIIIQK